jgi:hypothetical protein
MAITLKGSVITEAILHGYKDRCDSPLWNRNMVGFLSSKDCVFYGLNGV